jgi:hypothetical protein
MASVVLSSWAPAEMYLTPIGRYMGRPTHEFLLILSTQPCHHYQRQMVCGKALAGSKLICIDQKRFKHEDFMETPTITVCVHAELRYHASRVIRRKDEKGRLVFGVAGQESEVVSARGRGGQGAVGGGGEKEAVVVAARSRAQIAKVVRQLEEVRNRRGLLRNQRRKDGHAVVALVGYTNAGKSTLMSKLCKEV